jgi:hypothetical protein
MGSFRGHYDASVPIPMPALTILSYRKPFIIEQVLQEGYSVDNVSLEDSQG